MNDNIKFEIAKETISTMIALVTNEGYTPDDDIMRKLLMEKQEINECNQEVIDRVIEEYAPIIKNGGING